MPGRGPTRSSASPKTEPKPTSKGTVPSKRPKPGASEDEHAAKTQAPTAVQPVEPEDAYLTGVSRSLQRRLLGLNVEGKGGQAKPHPEATEAGLHATGSFTEAEDLKAQGPPKSVKDGKRK